MIERYCIVIKSKSPSLVLIDGRDQVNNGIAANLCKHLILLLMFVGVACNCVFAQNWSQVQKLLQPIVGKVICLVLRSRYPEIMPLWVQNLKMKMKPVKILCSIRVPLISLKTLRENGHNSKKS